MIRRWPRKNGWVWQAYAHRGGAKVYIGTYKTEAEARRAEKAFRARIAATMAHLDRAMASMLRHYATVLEARAKARGGKRGAQRDPEIMFDAADYLDE